MNMVRNTCPSRSLGALVSISKTFFILAALMLASEVQAGMTTDTVHVPGENPPFEGNLNKAVQTARDSGRLSQTVFELERGGLYVLTGTIIVPAGEHLTIVAPEPGPSWDTAPPQIRWSDTASAGNSPFNFRCFGDITLRNIWLLYARSNGEQYAASLQIEDSPDTVNGQRGDFEGVIFDYSAVPQNASGAVGITAKHFRGTFRNCYFRNCTDRHFRYYGRAVSFPFNSSGWHSDSILFENCTFANIGYVYQQESGDYADYVKFNHCTFLNVVMYPLESGWWKTLSVTNSVFFNTWMYGYLPILSGAVPEGGTIRIDSVSSFGFAVPFGEQDRRILFAHSSHGIEDWLRDWMGNNPASQLLRQEGRWSEIPVPQPMLNPGTLRFFDSTTTDGVKIFPFMNRAALYDSANPGFLFPPTDSLAIKGFLYHKWWDCCDTAWAFRPELSIEGVWPMPEDLAYTNLVLATGAMGGFPLGDLYRWWPEQYVLWDAQRVAEEERISEWLETGTDPALSSTRNSIGAPPEGFALYQNYPNPFNPTTTITYSVPRLSNASLTIYNLLGQKIATLYEGIRQPGTYHERFDATGHANGVYFYRFTAEGFADTKRLMVLK